MTDRTGPLAHLRVLDLTIARAGPVAVRLLTDWGADVIKVEAPPPSDGATRSITGARRGPDEQNLHRNKRSITLDLKNERGHALFLRMVAQADIVVENFRADVKKRLRIDYPDLAAVNPSLIYASISGFGQDGPDSARPGVDQILQGESGLMAMTGTRETGPMRVGVAISDTSAGMFLGQGILLALLHRERTGEGQWVHTSLLEAILAKLDFQAARFTMTGEVPQPQGNQHPTMVPMGTFQAADGLVNIAASSQRMWNAFCEALGARDLHDHPDYRGGRARFDNREQLRAAIDALTRTRTVAELVTTLNAAGVPCGPVQDVGAAFESAQVRHLGMRRGAPHPELGEVSLVRSPINLSRYPHAERLRRAAPDPGEDVNDVLADFGLDAAEVASLRTAGIV
ncbi:MAG: CoA transferase [Pseudomonadales bacterium]|nr:CoA transferase [Pseudomonadales bacterium]MCP5185081.1 CoA transferase [Pseudomonadales bacterium]